MTKGVMAFFWIVLAGISALYLFTLFTNPSAFGGQTARLDTSLADATSALTGSAGSLSADRISELLEARDKEFDEIKQQVRDLSQQVADLSARVNGGAGPLASNPAPSPETAAPPEAPAEAAAPAKPPEPEMAAAAPAITPPPPPEKPTPIVKPAAPVTVAAAELKPVEKEEPKPAAAPPPPSAIDNTAEAEKKDIPPPVTVSEAEVPPVDDTPDRADVASPSPSNQQGPSPAATETAHLDPIALPPDANDGTTRYGIEIGTVAKQDALRPLWREFLTNHAALVAGLQPRRVLAPDKKWRLIAGPFANAAEAAQACALFKKVSQPCEATVYAGDSL
jgi:hypothetical protein